MDCSSLVNISLLFTPLCVSPHSFVNILAVVHYSVCVTSQFGEHSYCFSLHCVCHLTVLWTSHCCSLHCVCHLTVWWTFSLLFTTLCVSPHSLVNILTAVHYIVCVASQFGEHSYCFSLHCVCHLTVWWTFLLLFTTLCVSPHDCACNLKKLALWGAKWFVCVIRYY